MRSEQVTILLLSSSLGCVASSASSPLGSWFGGMDIEAAFHTVGEFGPYQKRAVAVLVLTQVCHVPTPRFERIEAGKGGG